MLRLLSFKFYEEKSELSWLYQGTRFDSLKGL